MSNGNFTVQGVQTNLPQGSDRIGPLIQQLSPVSLTQPLSLTATATTITVPSGATGAFFVGPSTGPSTTVKWGPGSSTNWNINPSGFSWWGFDPANTPASIYVVTTGTATNLSNVQIC